MRNIQRLGGFSALYLATAHLIGIVIFLFVFDYPSIVEPSQKMDLLVNHQILIYVTNILMYVLFGFFLIIFVLSLYTRLKDRSSMIMQIAAAIGIIWAGALIGSGMVANSGIAPAIELFQDNPVQATAFWLGVESVANGLGGANGEILGGLMTLLISLAGIQGGLIPKSLNYLGIFIGTVGIISMVPGLKDLAGIFGMSQMIWFIWLGIILLKTQNWK